MLSYSSEELVIRWEEFFDEGDFAGKITAIADAYPEERSLYVDYADIERFDTDLAIYLMEHPQNAVYAAEQAIKQFIPPTEEAEIHFRVRGIPRDLRVEVRDLRAKHLGRLISVEGLVRKATEVRPRLVEAVFQCLRCGAIIKEVQEGMAFREPLECYQDQGGCSRTPGSTKFKLLDEGSRFVDTQKIEIQEPPEELRGGEQPQRLVAFVEDDLTGQMFPGDRVVLNGILRSVQRGRFSAKSTLFDIFLDVTSVEMEQVEYEEIEITEEDEERIKEEAASGDIIRKIVGSIAPSIYGMEVEKEALALQLFGGVPKELPDGRRIRGDPHILLVGDPGTAKSELLMYMTRLSPRGIYASGKASTAAGLTATAVRDEFGEGRWTLEAGALVLADKGLACLHPESEVIVGDVPTTIESLFDPTRSKRVIIRGQEAWMCPLLLPAVGLDDREMKVGKHIATLIVRRRYKGPILRVMLASGFQLRLTPDHRVLEGETLQWRELGELWVGQKIVGLQKLPGHNEPLFILDILPDDWIVQPSREEKAELRRRLLERFPTIAAVNRHYGLSREALNGRDALKVGQLRRILADLGLYDEWRHKELAYGRSRSTEKLRVATITPQLAYVLGFIYGDGCVKVTKRRSSIGISQSAVHLEFIRQVLLATRATTKRSWGMYHRRTVRTIRDRTVESRCYSMHMGSNLLAYIFLWLTNDDLRNLLKLDDEALKGFLAGVLDSDGSISIRKSRKQSSQYEHVIIQLMFSSSWTANRRFLYALRRLDVFARIRPFRGVLSVQITSRTDAARLVECLKPYSAKCKALPELKTRSSAWHEQVPSQPVAEVIRHVKPRPTKLLPKDIRSTFYEFKNGTRRPFKQSLGKLCDALARWLTPHQEERLRALAGYDYCLDRIERVEVEEYDGYVFDLRVPGVQNFLCDGACVHNCIDELEKMSEQDRSSIHTAMEQQEIHIAKAGITATLQTRCAILAAANPTLGRFDERKYIGEQIQLPATLLSRFDCIFPIIDRPESNRDRNMAEHILKSHLMGERLRHREAKPETQEEAVGEDGLQPYFEPSFLRKYVAYAKRIYPVMTPEAISILQEKYLEIRRQGETDGGAVPITPRQLEAFIRLAEASARARLSTVVTEEDAQRSVRIIEYWLQKVTGIEGTFDIDIVATGVSQSQRNQMIALREIIEELCERDGTADIKDILEMAEERGIPPSRVEAWLKRWSQEGEVYSPARNKWKLVGRF